MNKKKSGLRLLRLTGILTAAAAAVCGTAVSAAAASGDVNHDGKINASDATQLQSYLLTDTYILPDWTAADMDNNLQLAARDLTLLKRLMLKGPATVIVVPDEPQYIHL
ncbi:MAG: dockerin type I repeat-containing protein, partial [Oscillospiraceae bacterium]|nr:dockerin type I repeat-containing protein [Oscillospiraceae bacterium]